MLPRSDRPTFVKPLYAIVVVYTQNVVTTVKRLNQAFALWTEP